MSIVDERHTADRVVGLHGRGKLDKRCPPLEPVDAPGVYDGPSQVGVHGHPGDHGGIETSGPAAGVGVDRVTCVLGQVPGLYGPRGRFPHESLRPVRLTTTSRR